MAYNGKGLRMAPRIFIAAAVIASLFPVMANAKEGAGADSPSIPSVLISGDSLALAAAPAIARMLSGAGLSSELEATIGSGFANPGKFDWPAFFERDAARGARRAVVLSIGANDFNAIRLNGKRHDFGSDEWDAEYRARLRRLIAAARTGRTVLVIVSPPPMRDDNLERAVVHVSKIARDESVRNGAVHCDTSRALTPDGRWAERDGKVQIRLSDGVHFAPEGAGRFAGKIASCLAEAFDAKEGKGRFRLVGHEPESNRR
jgi:hypothetical protein